MTLPLSGYKMVDRELRLRMNISPSTDSSVHIELNTKDRDVSIGKLIIVDGYAEFEWGKFGDRKTVQLPSASSEGPVFYQLSVFRVDDQIAIVVDGNSVVSLHAGDGAPELAIICSEGATDFADIDVVQLEPAA